MENYHFIGVGGIGMSALARILVQKGAKVSGSDINSTYVTDMLYKEGVQVFIGHAAENLTHPTAVIYSTDVPEMNIEFQEAKRRNYRLLHRSELLAEMMGQQAPLLVTGTHGKTTTSSLLAHVCMSAELRPTFAIGGIISNLGSNGGYGNGPYFIAEADESDGSFLKYPSAFGAIITNIDNDHLNYWKTEEQLLSGFKQFAEKVSSEAHLFWCADDEKLSSLKLKGTNYGFGKKAHLYVNNYLQSGWKIVFDLSFEGKNYNDIEIPLIGGHNVLNASAVFGLALRLNIPEESIRRAFNTFQGVNRRAEKKGEADGISIYDDYAHHPTEIFATLRAMKRVVQENRLIVAFQPHRYTRTKDCMEQFAGAFENADELIITDIFSAGESPMEGVTSAVLLKKIQEKSASRVQYVPRSELVDFLTRMLRPKDVLVTMGAGDITKVGPEVLKRIER